MGQVTGRVFITVAGKRLSSKSGATLKFGDKKREMVQADHGTAGWKESTESPGVECTIIHDASTSLTEIQAITDGSGSFDTDTGKSFVLQGMVCLDALSLSDGEVKVSFGAMDCKEV
jgi:hypothetical protein